MNSYKFIFELTTGLGLFSFVIRFPHFVRRRFSLRIMDRMVTKLLYTIMDSGYSFLYTGNNLPSFLFFILYSIFDKKILVKLCIITKYIYLLFKLSFKQKYVDICTVCPEGLDFALTTYL